MDGREATKLNDWEQRFYRQLLQDELESFETDPADVWADEDDEADDQVLEAALRETLLESERRYEG